MWTRRIHSRTKRFNPPLLDYTMYVYSHLHLCITPVLTGPYFELLQPNAKIKKDRELEDISIHARLNSIGLDWYPIPDGVPKNHLFNRLHLTYLYGGGFVETCPIISQDKSSVHGRTDFAFFSLEFNPHAPTHPGAPGLSLSETPDDSVFEHLLVFTLIKSGQWLHVGHYRFTPSQSLTREEYVMQKPQVRT